MEASSTTGPCGLDYHHLSNRAYEEETEETITEKLTILGVACHIKCLIRFSVKVIQIQNTHCMIKESWTPAYIAGLEEPFTKSIDLFNSCQSNHPLSPPDFDCFQDNKIFQRIMNNNFEDSCINSGTISIDIQNLHQWFIQLWLNCEDGCNLLRSVNNN